MYYQFTGGTHPPKCVIIKLIFLSCDGNCHILTKLSIMAETRYIALVQVCNLHVCQVLSKDQLKAYCSCFKLRLWNHPILWSILITKIAGIWYTDQGCRKLIDLVLWYIAWSLNISEVSANFSVSLYLGPDLSWYLACSLTSSPCYRVYGSVHCLAEHHLFLFLACEVTRTNELLASQ